MAPAAESRSPSQATGNRKGLSHMSLMSSARVMLSTAVISPERIRSSIVAPTPTAWNTAVS